MRLYRLLKALITPFGKVLWTGSWSSGSLTIDGISKYALFLVFINGDAGIGMRDASMVRFMTVTGGGSQYIKGGYFSISGDKVTFATSNQLVHNASGNHGAGVTQPITKIVGLVPNWGGS